MFLGILGTLMLSSVFVDGPQKPMAILQLYNAIRTVIPPKMEKGAFHWKVNAFFAGISNCTT